ncbi:MAG TPA: sigma-70 family RNA polymerase sigma factor [Actinomycetota bacterium]
MRAGDVPNFDELFRHEYPTIVRTVYLMLGEREAAEEAAQEAFLELYIHWRKVSRYDKPGAWVRRVAIRRASRVRKHRRLELQGSVPEMIGGGEDDVAIRLVVLTLPVAQRAAVVLRYFEQLSTTDIAHLMDCSEATVRVHLHRARKRLGALLGEEVADAAR